MPVSLVVILWPSSAFFYGVLGFRVGVWWEADQNAVRPMVGKRGLRLARRASPLATWHFRILPKIVIKEPERANLNDFAPFCF
jgi:hypothetical protein